jgi:hypothetical protein
MANTVQIIAVTTGTSVNKTCKSILGECCPLSRWMLLLQIIEEEGRASQVYSSTKMWGLGMGKRSGCLSKHLFGHYVFVGF